MFVKSFPGDFELANLLSFNSSRSIIEYGFELPFGFVIDDVRTREGHFRPVWEALRIVVSIEFQERDGEDIVFSIVWSCESDSSGVGTDHVSDGKRSYVRSGEFARVSKAEMNGGNEDEVTDFERRSYVLLIPAGLSGVDGSLDAFLSARVCVSDRLSENFSRRSGNRSWQFRRH